METVIVTGAGSGLGLQSAIYLAQHGYRVFGTVFSEEERAQLAADAKARNLSIDIDVVDITDEQAVLNTVRSIVARAGQLNNLVHFAGVGLRGFVEDLSMEEVRHTMDVNFFGSLALVQAVLPHMRSAKAGKIVLTTSIAGRMPSMSIGGYASSKWAVEGLAECLRQELRLFNIWVTLLEPGLIHTPIFTKNLTRAARAKDPSGPYYRWFCQHESIVGTILRRNKFGGNDVAKVVHEILTARKPKLRYVVGMKAKFVLSLRRHVPGEFFQEAYWAFVRRMVTQPRKPVNSLDELEVNRP